MLFRESKDLAPCPGGLGTDPFRAQNACLSFAPQTKLLRQRSSALPFPILAVSAVVTPAMLTQSITRGPRAGTTHFASTFLLSATHASRLHLTPRTFHAAVAVRSWTVLPAQSLLLSRARYRALASQRRSAVLSALRSGAHHALVSRNLFSSKVVPRKGYYR